MLARRVCRFHTTTVFCLLTPMFLAAMGQAQEASLSAPLTAAAIEQSSQQPVPTLVRTQGSLVQHAKEKLQLRLSVYANEGSREPLWTEQQMIQLGPQGEYSILLGAGSAIGLPQSLFVAGEPRWLAIQVGEREELRVLLTSVPYAMKSADADTLGGVPANSFVTREELAARLGATAAALAVQAGQSQAIQPTDTPTGGGTAGSLPLWTSATALGNSALTQTGTGTAAKVGVATATPVATLDIGGTLNVRGNSKLTIGTVATAAGAVNSPLLQLGASTYSSGAAAAVAQTFAWQAQATANNSATASSRLALLFGSGTTAPAATGLSIAPNGIITFAAKQSFPGVGTGTITGVTAGTGLTGGGTTGTVALTVDTSKIPQLSAYNTFANGASFASSATSQATLTAKNLGAGDGLDVATGTGFAGYFSNNAVFDATVYAINTGNGNAGSFNNNSASRVALAGVNASADSGAIATYGSVSNGKAVYGIATSGSGVYGTSTSGYGVYGASSTGTAGGFSNISAALPSVYSTNGSTDLKATGIYGFAPNGKGIYGYSVAGTGVYGASSSGFGGYFANSSTFDATVYATNGSNGNAGSFNNNSSSHVALAGVNASTDVAAIGTYGNVSNGNAVYGIATGTGNGIYGTSSTGIGSYGVAVSGTGVAGKSQSLYGVSGSSESGIGVYGELGFPSTQFGGQSTLSGVWGDAGDNGNNSSYTPAGVIGTADNGLGGVFINNSKNYYALAAINKSGGGVHNFFKTFVAMSPEGSCGVGGAGDLTCTGQVKSVVTTASARQVETYSVQSSENWLEDYGSGRLQSGKAVIQLDAAFVDMANTGVEYHVFLTPKGDAQSLYITNETASGFEVRESSQGSSSIGFDYRIVAKRRGLEHVRMVDITERFGAEVQAVLLRTPGVNSVEKPRTNLPR